MKTGTPDLLGATFTGEGVTFLPRPRGRSGCVTTATTSCRDPASVSSDGTAKPGVPKNAIRTAHHSPDLCNFLISRTITSR